MYMLLRQNQSKQRITISFVVATLSLLKWVRQKLAQKFGYLSFPFDSNLFGHSRQFVMGYPKSTLIHNVV